MQSIKSEIKIKVQDKDHIYLCDTQCTLNECYEALSHLRCYIAGRIQEENEKIDQHNKSKVNSEVNIPLPEIEVI